MLKLIRGQLKVEITGLFLDPQRPHRCEVTSISQQVWEMADDQRSWKVEVDHVIDLAVAGSVTQLAVWPCVVTTGFCQPVVTVPSVWTT